MPARTMSWGTIRELRDRIVSHATTRPVGGEGGNFFRAGQSRLQGLISTLAVLLPDRHRNVMDAVMNKRCSVSSSRKRLPCRPCGASRSGHDVPLQAIFDCDDHRQHQQNVPEGRDVRARCRRGGGAPPPPHPAPSRMSPRNRPVLGRDVVDDGPALTLLLRRETADPSALSGFDRSASFAPARTEVRAAVPPAPCSRTSPGQDRIISEVWNGDRRDHPGDRRGGLS